MNLIRNWKLSLGLQNFNHRAQYKLYGGFHHYFHWMIMEQMKFRYHKSIKSAPISFLTRGNWKFTSLLLESYLSDALINLISNTDHFEFYISSSKSFIPLPSHISLWVYDSFFLFWVCFIYHLLITELIFKCLIFHPIIILNERTCKQGLYFLNNFSTHTHTEKHI